MTSTKYNTDRAIMLHQQSDLWRHTYVFKWLCLSIRKYVYIERNINLNKLYNINITYA